MSKDKTQLFFSSLERIGKLIEVKLEKGQHEKAEEYLNYLLESYSIFFSILSENPEFIKNTEEFENAFKNFTLADANISFLTETELAIEDSKTNFQKANKDISNVNSTLSNILYKVWMASHKNNDLLVLAP